MKLNYVRPVATGHMYRCPNCGKEIQIFTKDIPKYNPYNPLATFYCDGCGYEDEEAYIPNYDTD